MVTEVFDPAAVEVGALDLPRAKIRPVQLPRLRSGGRGRTHRLADPRRQGRVGRIVEIRRNNPSVREINPTVGVDVPQREVAVVGHDHGGILAVQGHQQRVEEINPPIVVHIPQNPHRHRLGPRDTIERFDNEIH